MAAALSSASTFLSLIGFSVSNDIVDDSHRTDAQMLRFSRRMMLVVGTVALGVAMIAPVDIFWLTYFVGTIFAASWGPVAFMSVWSKSITADGAYWGLISGFAGVVVARFVDWMGWVDWPQYLHPILLGSALSLVVIRQVSRHGEVTAEERDYRERLHVTPPGERACQVNLRWLPILLLSYGVIVTAVVMVYYVRPYHAIRYGPEAGIVWLSGETLLVLAEIPVMGFMAWLVRRELRRSYTE